MLPNTDIWYRVIYKLDESVSSNLYFTAYKAKEMSIDKDGNDIITEVDTDKSLDGWVKFDGCMNVEFESGIAHFCGRYYTKQFGLLFDKIYDKAQELGLDD